jgi:hypothetical protein
MRSSGQCAVGGVLARECERRMHRSVDPTQRRARRHARHRHTRNTLADCASSMHTDCTLVY